nr:hypothetical protein CFP56_51104 [Quercus suber]
MRIIVKNCLKYVGTFASHIAQGLAVLVWAFASLEYSSLSMMNIDYGRRKDTEYRTPCFLEQNTWPIFLESSEEIQGEQLALSWDHAFENLC